MSRIFKNKDIYLKMVLVHALLGVIMVYQPQLIKVWYVLFVFYVLYQVVIQQRFLYVALFLAYNLGIEIVGRMVDLSPVIPWELCKYITGPVILGILVFERFRHSNILPGFVIILLCLPAIILGQTDLERIIFSVFGILMSGATLAYFWNRQFNIRQLVAVLAYVVFPLISILVYITIDAPKFSEMTFQLGANFDTTGGFGSNQISTILGLGAFLIAIIFFVREKFTGYRWLDLFLLVYFLFRGLLSFSRGGIISAFLAFIIFSFLISRVSNIRKYGFQLMKFSMRDIILGIGGLVIVFIIANSITSGALLNRYKGETGGTLRGDREITLNTFTTGRYDILLSDLMMWGDYPFWGVGAGKSAALRANYGIHEIVAHTEYSRMLAEQGIFGLLIILFFTFLVPMYIFKNRSSTERAFLLSFVVLAIFTSFHAGMRTFTTPLFLGLSVIRICPYPEKKK